MAFWVSELSTSSSGCRRQLLFSSTAAGFSPSRPFKYFRALHWLVRRLPPRSIDRSLTMQLALLVLLGVSLLSSGAATTPVDTQSTSSAQSATPTNAHDALWSRLVASSNQRAAAVIAVLARPELVRTRFRHICRSQQQLQADSSSAVMEVPAACWLLQGACHCVFKSSITGTATACIIIMCSKLDASATSDNATTTTTTPLQFNKPHTNTLFYCNTQVWLAASPASSLQLYTSVQGPRASHTSHETTRCAQAVMLMASMAVLKSNSAGASASGAQTLTLRTPLINYRVTTAFHTVLNPAGEESRGQ